MVIVTNISQIRVVFHILSFTASSFNAYHNSCNFSLHILTFFSQNKIFFFKINNGYLTNYCANTRLVCTNLNAFCMLHYSNGNFKFENFWKVEKIVRCRLHLRLMRKELTSWKTPFKNHIINYLYVSVLFLCVLSDLQI